MHDLKEWQLRFEELMDEKNTLKIALHEKILII